LGGLDPGSHADAWCDDSSQEGGRFMWKWIVATVGRTSPDQPSAPAVPVAQPKRHPAHISGQYGLLYTFLESRYADMVVLTFGQIEDILGFPLPASSRTQAWWTEISAPAGSSGTAETGQSDAWRLAGRTAQPNLTARTVTFERRLG
jgi:hypothetical protein